MNTIDVLQANAVYANEEIARLQAELDAANTTIAVLQARLDTAVRDRDSARDTCHAAVDRVVTLLDEVIAVRGQLRGAVVLCDYCAGNGHWTDQAGLDNGCEVCGGRGLVPAVQEENHD